MSDGLPTKQTLEGSRLHEMKWLIYGPAGIGKSTFLSRAAAAGRSPLFLHTDPGLRFIKAYKKPILGWPQFQDVAGGLVRAAERGDALPYSMVVLDTVDILFRQARKYVCDKRGIEHISDEEWGKGYDIVRDEFELQLARLAALDQYGIGLGMISHSKDVEIKGRAIRTNKIVPTVPSQAYAMISGLCDVIGYCGYSNERADRQDEGLGRMIHFEPDETFEAKDRTGLLPKKCKLDFDVVRQYLEEGGVGEAEPEPAAQPRRKKRRA